MSLPYYLELRFGCSRGRRLVPERETAKRKTQEILESGGCKGGEFYQKAADKKTAGIIFQPIKVFVACCGSVTHIGCHSAPQAGQGPSGYPCLMARNFRIALSRAGDDRRRA
ncbi:hypothetical protein, partial [Escherichia coli]